ncbi:MAG: glycosyl hydrolase 115 family protein, partial [bacterium]
RKLTLSIPGGCPPVRLAAEDVAGDFSRRLGIEPVLVEDEAGAEIAISLQPGRIAPECFELEVGADGIRIRGGDARGAVFGLYHLAQVHLGIDPLAFWTGYCPVPVDRLEIPAGRYLAPPPAFALRGWFLNDEDLLRSFPHAPHGPYIDPGLYREIFRSALRLRLNLIVPATLIDALDDEEAEVIALAAEHGLLIGNHHMEPLGVFPGYQFRRYCRARGLDESYSWRHHPDRLTACWEAYIQRLASFKNVVWTIGYWFGAQADAVRRLYDDWFKAFVVIESQPGLPRYRLFLDGSHQALFEGLVELLRSERVDHDSFNAAFQWRMVRMSLLSKDEQDIHNRSEHSNPAIWRLRELEALLGWVETVLPLSEQAFSAVAAGVRLLAPRLENHSAGRFLEDGLGVQATLMAALTATNLALTAAVRSRLAGDSAAARKNVSRAIVCLKQAIAGRVGSGEKRFGVWYAGEKNLSLSELLDACRRLRTA